MFLTKFINLYLVLFSIKKYNKGNFISIIEESNLFALRAQCSKLVHYHSANDAYVFKCVLHTIIL